MPAGNDENSQPVLHNETTTTHLWTWLIPFNIYKIVFYKQLWGTFLTRFEVTASLSILLLEELVNSDHLENRLTLVDQALYLLLYPTDLDRAVELLSLQEKVITQMDLNGEVLLSVTTVLQQVSELWKQTTFEKKKKKKTLARVKCYARICYTIYIGQFWAD